MKPADINKIDLGKLSGKLRRYEKQWIAISEDNIIVGSGQTYREAVDQAKKIGIKEIVLFKVPPLDYSLAP